MIIDVSTNTGEKQVSIICLLSSLFGLFEYLILYTIYLDVFTLNSVIRYNAHLFAHL